MNNQNILLGLLLISTGAFTSGSFAIPFGKIRSWSWETYWLIFSFGAYILFPLTSCLIFSPEFLKVIAIVPVKTLLLVFALGAVYGIGNLSFGLSLRFLGISLGYALSLGLMLAIGTLIPPLIDGRLRVMMQDSGGNLLIIGVLVAIVGIAITGTAGFLKDKSITDAKNKESVSEFNYLKGVVAALLVGVTGSAMSLGFEQGSPIAEIAGQQGINPFFITMPVMLVLLSGTFVTTVIWCIYLGIRNKSLGNYIKSEVKGTLPANYLFSLLSGLLWFSQFILFGMGKSKMGPFTFTSWGILMGLTIVFATLWGLYRKEWKGASKRIIILMLISLLIIIVASYIIGISGSV
jgi:L-rhamnose-H+ transport protein